VRAIADDEIDLVLDDRPVTGLAPLQVVLGLPPFTDRKEESDGTREATGRPAQPDGPHVGAAEFGRSLEVDLAFAAAEDPQALDRPDPERRNGTPVERVQGVQVADLPERVDGR